MINLHRVSFTLVVIFTLAATALGRTALAQGTPVPESNVVPFTFDTPYAPLPEQCTTAAYSTDQAASLLATPAAGVTPAVTEHGTVALPSGAPADQVTEGIVDDLLTQLWACNNARNKAAILTLFTDQAIQQLFGSTMDAPFDMAELRADVAAALTPGEPRSNDELASIDAVVSVLQQDDGAVGVLVLNSDPNVSDGDQVLDYFAFALDNGTMKVSNVILDPFDLTADYGFKKSA